MALPPLPPLLPLLQELVQRYAILPAYEELSRDRESGAVHVRVSAAGVPLGESFEATNFRGGCRCACAGRAWICRHPLLPPRPPCRRAYLHPRSPPRVLAACSHTWRAPGSIRGALARNPLRLPHPALLQAGGKGRGGQVGGRVRCQQELAALGFWKLKAWGLGAGAWGLGQGAGARGLGLVARV